MKLYAEKRGRRAAQVVTDLVVLLWVWAWTRLGFAIRDLVLAFAEPGRQVEQAGNEVAGAADRAAEGSGGIPLVGELLSQPFASIAGAARRMAAAGVAQQEATADAATTLGLAVAVAPIVTVLIVWLWWRLRWAREATAAARLRDAGAGHRLFALRALTTMPLPELRALAGDDPYQRFEDGDVAVLAEGALRSLGLRTRGLRTRSGSPPR